ncbi:hypothetical protein ASPBRDRAFT_73342 [Aspergillus brasiliensis CBS 101740]|uniref:Uncharacterized protein n=1 Tax=Aspergillus brasiliensis (strain CBS 101740 / IMI 381727 / IBT 21946) TaxID=767769 RepID=A0A1L9UU71_ASPBC|nr:hypothetical protein ASPBRDRAFT_73342 [Aspergillus brasiliensis CBS 101740]
MPYYVHLQEHVVDGMDELIAQRCYLLTAANATVAKKFLIGLSKYAQTPDAAIQTVKAVNLEWWNCDVGSAGAIQRLYNQIMFRRSDDYNSVEELHHCRGAILLCDLNAANWPILPINQNTSLDGLDQHCNEC